MVQSAQELLDVIQRTLTLRQRRVCSLVWFDRLPMAAIGQRYGMQRSAVCNMVIRAEQRLRSARIEPPPRRRKLRVLPLAQLSACGLPRVSAPFHVHRLDPGSDPLRRR